MHIAEQASGVEQPDSEFGVQRVFHNARGAATCVAPIAFLLCAEEALNPDESASRLTREGVLQVFELRRMCGSRGDAARSVK